MCCKHSLKVDEDLQQLNSECSCCKWHQYACGIFFLVCVVPITCSVYCTYILFNIWEMRNTCMHYQQNVLSTGDMIKDIPVRQMDIIPQKNERQKIMTKDKDVFNSRMRSKRATEGKKKCKCPKMLSAHYEQKTKPEYFVGIEKYTDTQMINTCKYIKQWKGKLCKAGDFKSDNNTLQVFQPAAYQKAKLSPFKGIKDGKFTTKKKGLYLVYAQVSFYDTKEFQQMKVVHRKKGSNEIIKEYACVRGVHNTNKSVNNTCSITALYFLGKGDYLTVDLFDKDLNLNFSGDNTFFGAVLLR